LCNGKDDNCDGKIDEAFPTLGQPCNQESCQGAGQFVCNSAGTDVECSVSAAGPTPEVCDGRDNDCDGLIDEAPGPGEPAMPGVGVACGSAVVSAPLACPFAPVARSFAMVSGRCPRSAMVRTTTAMAASTTVWYRRAIAATRTVWPPASPCVVNARPAPLCAGAVKAGSARVG
jgi:hypothetical protein